MESAIRQNIISKRDILVDKNQLVSADNSFVDPILKFFESKFCWEYGEYEIFFRVVTNLPNVSFNKKYKITIFESESSELRAYSDEYKYGFGVFLNPPNNIGIAISLSDE